MDSMDLDMDMDVDVDFVPDEPIAPEAAAEDAAGERSDGEVAEDEPNDELVPTKVHIRGLDVMKPDDIKAFVSEHFTESPFDRVEWIDDSSANLLFASEPLAARALDALAADPLPDVSQLPRQKMLTAKPYSHMPDVRLSVRLAVASDRKQAGAAQRSRFYLLNPEYDPEERHRHRRSNETTRNRYRDREGGGGGGYGRRRGGVGAGRYDDDEPAETFDVSLYDDDEASRASRAPASRPRRRQRSYSSDDEGQRSEPGRRSYHRDEYRDDYNKRNDNRGKELFPLGRGGGGSRRDRSASPGRDRDRDRSMDVDRDDLFDDNNNSNSNNESTAARNRDRARAIRSHKSRTNRSKELFPEKAKSGGRLGDGGEDPADLIAKGIALPLMDGSNDNVGSNNRPRRLEDRITAPGQGSGRLADRISTPGGGGGSSSSSAFNIRGTANQKGSADQGFAIKGVAGKSSVRELFPDSFGGSGNSGKELFADRLEGRTRQRQRAGDLFD